ncbi:MAG: thioesterase [Mogibacterium sp.]|nr:thioesterase [Mogibacterium sp.]
MSRVIPNSVYEKKTLVRECNVNESGLMKTSAFFSVLQDISDEHVEALGTGPAAAIEQGFYWIIASQRAEIDRMPRLGEEILVRTWMGRNRHVLMPRYYTVESVPSKDVNGSESEMLARVAICWTFITVETRELVVSAECPISITENISEMKSLELNPWRGPKPITSENVLCSSRDVTVPHEYIDRNGHLNNAHYFDLVEAALAQNGLIAQGDALEPRRIIARYTSEAMEGDILKVSSTEAVDRSEADRNGTDRLFYITLDSEKGNHFKLELETQ